MPNFTCLEDRVLWAFWKFRTPVAPKVHVLAPFSAGGTSLRPKKGRERALLRQARFSANFSKFAEKTTTARIFSALNFAPGRGGFSPARPDFRNRSLFGVFAAHRALRPMRLTSTKSTKVDRR